MEFSSKIGIGTVQFGIPYGISNVKGQTSIEEVGSILQTAAKIGIDTIDTAMTYGNSEEILGKNVLEHFKVVSKFMPSLKDEKIEDQLVESLKKLRIASLYGYLAHRPLDIQNKPWQWEELKDLKNRGLISKIGFSLNEPAELELLLNKNMIPDLIQAPFNYLDRRFELQLIKMNSRGCEIHTRSVFLQGLFFTDTSKLSPFYNEVKPIIKALQANYENLSSSLLKFALEKTFIDKIIIGIENRSQLLQNLDNLDKATQLPEQKQVISENILMPVKWPK